MPPIELRSVESFCAWLDDTFISVVPFGLSPRLRPLVTSSQSTSPQSLLLLRPHAGHVLLSLMLKAETNKPQGEGIGNARRSAPATEGQCASGSLAENAVEALRYNLVFFHRSPRAHLLSAADSADIDSEQQTYPCLLQALLQLARSDGGCTSPISSVGVSSSSSAFTIPSAAVDGVGRKLSLYTALLRHCALWWNPCGGKCSEKGVHVKKSQLHQLRGKPSQPFLFFDANPVVSVPLQQTREFVSANAQRCLQRVLRRLCQRDGWCLSSAVSTDEDVAAGRQDWLDYVVRRALQADLQPSGAYCDLLERELEKDKPSASPPVACGEDHTVNVAMQEEQVVSAAATRAVLWHVLATEVDGSVLSILCQLIIDFIFNGVGSGCAAASPAALVTSLPGPAVDCRGGQITKQSKLRSLLHVRLALRRLVQDPQHAFTCYPAGDGGGGDGAGAQDTAAALLASPSARRAPISGPLSLSRLLPPELCVAPFRTDAEAADAASPFQSSPRFFVRGTRVPHGDGVLRQTPLRVLLLRVDPEGDWLPMPEQVASQRSFYASYARQAEWDGQSGNSMATEDEEAEDDYAELEARSAGMRSVARPTEPSSFSLNEESMRCAATCSSAEEATISLLTAHVMRQPPFAHVARSAGAKDYRIWAATVRLYLYALLTGARVIATPEKLPPLTKAFGYRHLAQLHRSLCAVRSAWDAQSGVCTQELKRSDSSAGSLALDPPSAALLRTACDRAPPVAVYLVDQLDLNGFTRLQDTANYVGAPSSSATTTHSCLPVVLCRDVLRRGPTHNADLVSDVPARGAPLPDGVFNATHCGVLDEEVVCRAWSSCPPTAAVDTLMEACVGAEQAYMPGRRNLFLAAFEHTQRDLKESPVRQKERVAKRGDRPELNTQRWSSILLVAPTHVHAMFYVGLLRKAALALLDALPDAPTRAELRGATFLPPAQSFDRTQHGVVRGGGAFYVALARHLRLLAKELRNTHATTTAGASSSYSANAFEKLKDKSSSSAVVHDMPARDVPWVCYVLYLLAEACAAVATQHAEPLIERGRGGTDVFASALTRGPRARRRLWLEVLREVVDRASPASPSLNVSSGDMRPLYVRHVDVLDAASFSSYPTAATNEFAAAPGDLSDSTSYETAMRLFAGQPLQDSVSDGCEEAQQKMPPLLEPLSTNVRAVRESLSLLQLTLSASM